GRGPTTSSGWIAGPPCGSRRAAAVRSYRSARRPSTLLTGGAAAEDVSGDRRERGQGGIAVDFVLQAEQCDARDDQEERDCPRDDPPLDHLTSRGVAARGKEDGAESYRAADHDQHGDQAQRRPDQAIVVVR